MISAAELIHHFLSLPAASGCSTSRLNNAEDLLLLWTRLCREPPAALCMCERQGPGKVRTQFSGHHPQVISENCLCSFNVIWQHFFYFHWAASFSIFSLSHTSCWSWNNGLEFQGTKKGYAMWATALNPTGCSGHAAQQLYQKRYYPTRVHDREITSVKTCLWIPIVCI